MFFNDIAMNLKISLVQKLVQLTGCSSVTFLLFHFRFDLASGRFRGRVGPEQATLHRRGWFVRRREGEGLRRGGEILPLQ